MFEIISLLKFLLKFVPNSSEKSFHVLSYYNQLYRHFFSGELYRLRNLVGATLWGKAHSPAGPFPMSFSHYRTNDAVSQTLFCPVSHAVKLRSCHCPSECSVLWQCLRAPAAVIEALLRNVCHGPSSGLKGLQTSIHQLMRQDTPKQSKHFCHMRKPEPRDTGSIIPCVALQVSGSRD